MLLAALLIFSAPCLALDPFRIIVRVTGKVASRQPGQDDWSPIWRSRVLTDGDMARTYQDARACVKLADGSQFTVGQDSVVEMTKFELTDAGRTVVFNLLVGKIRARGAKAVGKQSKFEVKTPNGVLAARGTDFYVKQTPGAQSRRPEMLASRVIADATQPGPAAMRTWLIVFDGRVDVTSSREKRSFSAGDWAIIEPDGTIRSRPSDVWTPEGPFA
ncbi:MAG: FecR domain-containing protein, partial [Armatimonadetes bacterium]|nr:FecR domain-containing protein [Armatimonadota bacterium]